MAMWTQQVPLPYKTFLFYPSSSALRSLSHPPTSVYQLRRSERRTMSWGESSARSNLITLPLTLQTGFTRRKQMHAIDTCSIEEAVLNTPLLIAIFASCFHSDRLSNPAFSPQTWLPVLLRYFGFSHRMLRGQGGCSSSDHILWWCVCVFVCIPVCCFIQWKRQTIILKRKRVNCVNWWCLCVHTGCLRPHSCTDY